MRVTEVEPLPDRRLRVRFRDGLEGIVDVRPLIRLGGVFAPLADDALFRQVWVDAEARTVTWPNGADIAPDVMHEIVAKQVSSPAALGAAVA